MEKGKLIFYNWKRTGVKERNSTVQTLKGNPAEEGRESSICLGKLSPRKLRGLFFLSFPLGVCLPKCQLGEAFLVTQYTLIPPHPHYIFDSSHLTYSALFPSTALIRFIIYFLISSCLFRPIRL